MSISLGKKLHFSLSLKIPQMNNGVMRLSYRLLLLTNIDLGPDHLLSIISIILDEFKLVCKLVLKFNKLFESVCKYSASLRNHLESSRADFS